MGLPLASSAAEQRPTFSAATRRVRADVLVTEQGRPVGGLTDADFDIFDNGVKHRVHRRRGHSQDGAGWHTLDVRVRRRGTEVTARPRYFAPR